MYGLVHFCSVHSLDCSISSLQSARQGRREPGHASGASAGARLSPRRAHSTAAIDSYPPPCRLSSQQAASRGLTHPDYILSITQIVCPSAAACSKKTARLPGLQTVPLSPLPICRSICILSCCFGRP
jgi:hypothetical protein